jgi:F-type H+-transporting ATPase subunit c
MKLTRLAAIVAAAFLMMAPALLAQGNTPPAGGAAAAKAAEPMFGKAIGAGLGAGIALIGAGIGFGKIGSAALESMSRQPEVADKVSGSMITIAALLEGATFFGLLVCLVSLFV